MVADGRVSCQRSLKSMVDRRALSPTQVDYIFFCGIGGCAVNKSQIIIHIIGGLLIVKLMSALI